MEKYVKNAEQCGGATEESPVKGNQIDGDFYHEDHEEHEDSWENSEYQLAIRRRS